MKQNTIGKILLLLLLTTSTAILTLYITMLMAGTDGSGTGKILWNVYSGLFYGLCIAWFIISDGYLIFRVFKEIMNNTNTQPNEAEFYRPKQNTISKVLPILLANTGTAIATMLITWIIAKNTVSRSSEYWAVILNPLISLTLIFIVLSGCYITFRILKREKQTYA